MGTLRVKDPAITLDAGGTDVEIQLKATNVGIEAEQNYADHPRTGDAPPYQEYIDATYSFELGYVHGFGTDGVVTAFDTLAGTEVDVLLETSDGVVSVDYPTYTFTIVVPSLSPLPATEFGEFASGDISIPIKGVPVKATS